MNRLFKNLEITNKNHRTPTKADLLTKNWRLDISLEPEIIKGYDQGAYKYRETYEAKLVYARYVQFDSRLTTEQVESEFVALIKRELGWQLYGDSYHIINMLRQAIYSENTQESLEILNILEDELNGVENDT